MKARAIEEGTCAAECGEPIRPGDVVVHVDDEPVHEACEAKALDLRAHAHDECDAEIYSWDYFSVDAVDPYWIRCGRVGPHEEHEDSNTGAKWRDDGDGPVAA